MERTARPLSLPAAPLTHRATATRAACIMIDPPIWRAPSRPICIRRAQLLSPIAILFRLCAPGLSVCEPDSALRFRALPLSSSAVGRDSARLPAVVPRRAHEDS